MAEDYTGLYMKYLGVLSLLGKVSHHFSALDQVPIETAFRDANAILEQRNASIRFHPDHRGGWSAFDEPQQKEE